MKLKITITGKVHDVGYRLHLLNLADSLFIDRFDARNVLLDGKQAVVVLVEADEETLKEFVEFVKTSKPEKAIVEEIKVEEFKGKVRSINSYRNSLMIEQLNKIVQIGLNMLDKQDLMLQKQDETIRVIKEGSEKTRAKIDESTKTICDKIDESTKILSEKIDKVSEKIDQSTKKICSKIDDLRSDLKSYLDERLRKLEEDLTSSPR